jgi:hypothetical protein
LGQDKGFKNPGKRRGSGWPYKAVQQSTATYFLNQEYGTK